MSMIRSLLLALRALFRRPDALLIKAEALSAHGQHAAAFRLFVRAARSGLAPAQRRVGACYLNGEGVPPNLGAAMRWLTKAAEANDVAAQTQVASLALRGAHLTPATTLFTSP